MADLTEKRQEIKGKWESEKAVIQGIQREKENIDKFKIEAEQAERGGDFGKVAEIRYGKIVESEKKLESFKQQLKEMQEGSPLLKEEVDAEDIAAVVSKWTGIPLSKMIQSEREKLLHLEEELGKRVAGQTEAIVALSDAVSACGDGFGDLQIPGKACGQQAGRSTSRICRL